MEFESPDVMKDFPGLYSTESAKRNNDSDYSDCDSADKSTRKESLLIGKRKEKKDRGYAALEGESSPEEDHPDSKSPSKTKKTKSFKFTSKNKEKDKKDKKVEVEKKKERKSEKNKEKEKVKCDKKEKKVKHISEEKINIEDVLPIFGACLSEAITRSRCHDGVDLPLPVRECIDHLEIHGRTFEGVYKVNGIKSKVLHIKKLYNQREPVNLEEYDVPTVTSVLKMYFRELPEPILGDALTQFEEAGAVQNVSMREATLIDLLDKLPAENRTLLAWIIVHLDHITSNEKQTRMNAQAMAMSLSPVLQMSHRLLAALLCHCRALFAHTVLNKYCPPIVNLSRLPDECVAIQDELKKQESLLSLIHYEMNLGFVSKKREELLWEVQRIITQLKRKLRSIQKCTADSAAAKAVTTAAVTAVKEPSIKEDGTKGESSKMTKSLSCSDDSDAFTQLKNISNDKCAARVQEASEPSECTRVDNTSDSDIENLVLSNNQRNSDSENQDSLEQKLCLADTEITDQLKVEAECTQPMKCDVNLQTTATLANQVQTNAHVMHSPIPDETLLTLHHQNQLLNELKDWLISQIAAEKSDVVYLKYCLANQMQIQKQPTGASANENNHGVTDMDKLEEVMDLLTKENRILRIKKTDLVREIMENREACVMLKTHSLSAVHLIRN